MKQVNYKHVRYLPTISLKQVLSWIDSTDNILKLKGWRRMYFKTDKAISTLPYVSHLIHKEEMIRLNFSKDIAKYDKHGWQQFDAKAIMNYMNATKLNDLVIKELVFVNDSEKLKEILGVTTKIHPGIKDSPIEPLVVTLENTYQGGKKAPQNLKDQIGLVMSEQIESMKFQLATLDVVRIETYNSFKFKLGKNLLPAMNQDVHILRESILPTFENGIKHVRSYVQKETKEWVLESDKNDAEEEDA